MHGVRCFTSGRAVFRVGSSEERSPRRKFRRVHSGILFIKRWVRSELNSISRTPVGAARARAATALSALPNGLFHPKSCFWPERRPDIGIRWPHVGGGHLRGPKGSGPCCLSPLLPLPLPPYPSLSLSLSLCPRVCSAAAGPLLPRVFVFFPNVAVLTLMLSADSERDSSVVPLRPASYSRYHPCPMVTGFQC